MRIHRIARSHFFAIVIGMFVVLVWMSGASPPTDTASYLPILDFPAGRPLPYTFNRATLRTVMGALPTDGGIRVHARGWEGSVFKVYEDRDRNSGSGVDIAFYHDENTRSLILETGIEANKFRNEIEFSPPEEWVVSSENAEFSALHTMKRLPEPRSRLGAPGPWNGREHRDSGNLQELHRRFSASCRADADPLFGAGIALIGGIGSLTAGFARKKTAIAAICAVFLLFGILIASVMPYGGRIFLVPAGREYGPNLNMIALWGPGDRLIPFGELLPPGESALFRFSEPPSLVRSGGELYLNPRGFISGWMMRMNP